MDAQKQILDTLVYNYIRSSTSLELAEKFKNLSKLTFTRIPAGVPPVEGMIQHFQDSLQTKNPCGTARSRNAVEDPESMSDSGSDSSDSSDSSDLEPKRLKATTGRPVARSHAQPHQVSQPTVFPGQPLPGPSTSSTPCSQPLLSEAQIKKEPEVAHVREEKIRPEEAGPQPSKVASISMATNTSPVRASGCNRRRRAGAGAGGRSTCCRCCAQGHCMPARQRMCFCCGKSDHFTHLCPYLPASFFHKPRAPMTCYRCNEPGHIARDCPSFRQLGTGYH